MERGECIIPANIWHTFCQNWTFGRLKHTTTSWRNSFPDLLLDFGHKGMRGKERQESERRGNAKARWTVEVVESGG